VEKARKEDPTALQEVSDSTNGDPFRVLVATVLSQRTKDRVTALAYAADRAEDALFSLQERATLFVAPGEDAYGGMIVGENSRTDDMDVNVSKEKKLTNMRTTASDENIKLEPPRKITLELALEFIEDDELIEVTPDHIRLRKRVLEPHLRKKAAKRAMQPA